MKELSVEYIQSLSGQEIRAILGFIDQCEREGVLETNHPLLRVQIQFLRDGAY